MAGGIRNCTNTYIEEKMGVLMNHIGGYFQNKTRFRGVFLGKPFLFSIERVQSTITSRIRKSFASSHSQSSETFLYFCGNYDVSFTVGIDGMTRFHRMDFVWTVFPVGHVEILVYVSCRASARVFLTRRTCRAMVFFFGELPRKNQTT